MFRSWTRIILRRYNGWRTPGSRRPLPPSVVNVMGEKCCLYGCTRRLPKHLFAIPFCVFFRLHSCSCFLRFAIPCVFLRLQSLCVLTYAIPFAFLRLQSRLCFYVCNRVVFFFGSQSRLCCDVCNPILCFCVCNPMCALFVFATPFVFLRGF